MATVHVPRQVIVTGLSSHGVSTVANALLPPGAIPFEVNHFSTGPNNTIGVRKTPEGSVMDAQEASALAAIASADGMDALVFVYRIRFTQEVSEFLHQVVVNALCSQRLSPNFRLVLVQNKVKLAYGPEKTADNNGVALSIQAILDVLPQYPVFTHRWPQSEFMTAEQHEEQALALRQQVFPMLIAAPQPRGASYDITSVIVSIDTKRFDLGGVLDDARAMLPKLLRDQTREEITLH